MFRKSFGKYRVVYSHLWRSYGAFWQVRLAFVLQIVNRLCKLVVLPVAMSLLIARLSVRDFAGAQQAVFVFVFFSLLLGVMTPLIKYIGLLGENKAYRKITINYFSRLVHADLDYFHSNLSGYLTTATRQYVDSCMQLVRALRDKYMSTVFSIFFPLIVIAWLDPWLGLVTLFLSFVQAIYLLWASHAISPYRTRSRELYKKNSGRMADIISNILAVKAAAKEDEQVKQVEKGAYTENDVYKQRYVMQAKLIAARETITVSFFMVLLWLTVRRMSVGAIDITGVVLTVTYTTTILTGIYSLSEDLDEHDDFVDKIIPAFEVLHRQNTVRDPKEPLSFDRVRGGIEFRNVSFSYSRQNNKPVLQDFSLKIPSGQKLGVVGLSGAGKSTLTKLLLRFDDVHDGGIFMDNKDIREILQTDLRSHIAYVPQEPLLFHASIRENVVLTYPNAKDSEVQKALRTAHAWEFIEQLPEGVDSIVGERGVKLSGGQKQRIAIARAVLQRSPIMILDEATSALDSESEQIIKSSFSEILKGRTAIVVAHRLSTLSEMDRIIVIDGGKLVEDGTHEELLAANGIYASLWKRQQRLMD